MPLPILLVGYGRMGRMVASLAREHDCSIAGTVDLPDAAQPDRWPAAEVAIDFSLPDAVPENLPRLAARGTSVVIGTTGWQAQEAAMREVAEKAGIGVVAAPNFAIGVNLFTALVERAAELWKDHGGFGAWIHELHHAAKRDAPSGTALSLEAAMRRRGYAEGVAMSSTRVGAIPGTHTVGFDAPAETITLTHTARDRSAFARGALEAAKWLRGRRGWYSMRDVLGIQ